MLIALALAQALAAGPSDSVESLSVQIDSARHEVHIVTRPFDLPDMSGMHDHSQSHDTPVYRFTWPVAAS